MKPRYLLFLFTLGLSINLIIASFQESPGYIDADYYYAGGVQLIRGNGFNEPYIWNYIDNPQSLPHPSHTYWMPLASIISALGMWIAGQETYAAARVPFILLSACVPLMVFKLAQALSPKTSVALTAALFSIFSLYYAPFMPVTDNYPAYILLGCLFFLLINWNSRKKYFIFGVISGFMALGRTDGLLWLGIAIIIVYTQNPKIMFKESPRLWVPHVFNFLGMTLLGYLSIMGWWHIRNLVLFNSILTPGGAQLLWLTNYDQTFSYPASQLTMQSFFDQGLASIISTRSNAIVSTLDSAIYYHFNMVLFPITFLGIWILRKEESVRVAVFGWLALFLVMTLIFPFAGQRGSFHHAGAAFQSIWWVACAFGIDHIAELLTNRGFFRGRALVLFNGIALFLMVFYTNSLFYSRVIENGWSKDDGLYFSEKERLKSLGISEEDTVIVKNPPGFYLALNTKAIMIPYGDESSLLTLADQFNASYLILDENAWLTDGNKLYKNPKNNIRFQLIDEFRKLKIFKILPSP